MCGSARHRVLALALLAVSVLLAPPANAVAADGGSSVRPEFFAAQADRPGFDLDDEMDATIEPEDDAVIVERLDVPDWLVEPKPERDVPNPEMEDLSPTR